MGEHHCFEWPQKQIYTMRSSLKGRSDWWPDKRSKGQQIENRKKWDNRSKINIYSYWLKLSIICELQNNYPITAITRKPWPCLSGPWDLIWIYHNRTKQHNRTCYMLYNKWALKSDWPIRNLNYFYFRSVVPIFAFDLLSFNLLS